MSLLIQNTILDGSRVSILIEDGIIHSIHPVDDTPTEEAPAQKPGPAVGAATATATAERVIDAAGKIILPSFKNGHTHAAMTLLRGYADDMKLQPWLQEKIWPAEAKLLPEDIYWGTRLAALEMIKSGTTFCNDMYFHFPQAWKAFLDSGIKAAVGSAIIDQMDPEIGKKAIQNTRETFEKYAGTDEKLLFSPAPHAIYTVSEDTLRWVSDYSRQHDLVVHIHLSETEQEVRDCLTARGMRPAEYLEHIGFLGPNIVAAHGIWLSESEMNLLAKHKVTVVHNPASNMKLASGSCFQFEALHKRGVPLMLGTDGCSSNNNLDMTEEMKIAALLQKHHFADTELMKAGQIFSMAVGGMTAVYPNLSSSVKPGAFADLLLINPDHPRMTPNYNTTSNMVYSCGESAIDTVICNGYILMQNRTVADEDMIVREARRCASELGMRIRSE